MYEYIASPDRGDRTQAGGGAKRNPCKGCMSILQAPIGAIEFLSFLRNSVLLAAPFYRGFATLHPCVGCMSILQAPTGATEFLSYLWYFVCRWLLFTGVSLRFTPACVLPPLSGLCGESPHTILFVIKSLRIQVF